MKENRDAKAEFEVQLKLHYKTPSKMLILWIQLKLEGHMKH